MATLGTETYGKSTTFRVLFVDPTGRRQTVRLGRVSKRIAETAKLHVEELLAARIAGHSVSPATAAWLDAISDEIHERLSRVGLTPPRVKEAPAAAETLTLGDHLERYFATLGDQKKNTKIAYGRAKRLLLEFFGAKRLLSSIVEGDADDYAAWLRRKFAAASAAVDLRRARQFFKVAVRRRVISANPFAEVSCGPQTNEKRKHEVTRETIEKVIAACPNAEWRLLFALARYGGLRVPSEVAELKWSDVKWSESRFVVHARKVEHHEGHETRVVPIFEELRPYLEEAFEAAPEGSVHVLSIARPGIEARNLRTQALRIVESAGVEAWPRLFNNLRASRADELERTFPSHVVDKWIGNSAKIRRDHYLLTLESDFARAAGYPAQNPAQSASGGGLLGPSRRESGSRFSRETRENAAKQYPRQGSKERGFPRENRGEGDPPGTESGTLSGGSPDVVELLRLLAGLTPEERSTLLDLARSASRGGRPARPTTATSRRRPSRRS